MNHPILPTLSRLVLLVTLSISVGLTADGRAAEPVAQFYLVGAGPGDPDLLTLRAVEVLSSAEVVFCSKRLAERFGDYLEGKRVVTGYWRLFPYYGRDLSDVPPAERAEAERLAEQRAAFIAEVRAAVEQGATVAVLDSGDPLIYGPWEWCLEEFEDLDPVVVPGLSSFNAANAALRRGPTRGKRTKSVILSADDWPGKTDTIDRLAAIQATMVLFTMRADLADFIEKMLAGYPADTPVAIVQHAGYADRERVIRATLGTILDVVAPEELPFEYLLYVGDFLDHRYRPRE